MRFTFNMGRFAEVVRRAVRGCALLRVAGQDGVEWSVVSIRSARDIVEWFRLASFGWTRVLGSETL